MTIERSVAGHRVLRLLARGDRSQVWLAVGELVLKVLDAGAPIDAPGREAEALHRARGEHVIELLDVSLGAEGSVLVFPRQPRGSLAELLLRRNALDAGEAVTILAPIAVSLTRLHAGGVAHCGLAPGSVLFRADGAPMLTGFGRAQLFRAGLPEVELEREPGVIADRAALQSLADIVLARTTGERGKVATRMRDEFRRMEPAVLAERMAPELFDLAAARPVRFETDDAETGARVGRVVAVAEPVVAIGDPRSDSDSDSGSWSRALLTRMLDSGPGTLARGALKERWHNWSRRRRRAVLAGGAAGLALAVAFAAVPGPQAPVVSTSAESVKPDAPVAPVEEISDELSGDDPMAALRDLAGRRDRCFRDLSFLCLDGVDEVGSGALEADHAALNAVVGGGDAPPRLILTSAILVERLGDSALVDLGPDSDPASVLLLKGDAGWRIRDYLAPLGAG